MTEEERVALQRQVDWVRGNVPDPDVVDLCEMVQKAISSLSFAESARDAALARVGELEWELETFGDNYDTEVSNWNVTLARAEAAEARVGVLQTALQEARTFVADAAYLVDPEFATNQARAWATLAWHCLKRIDALLSSPPAAGEAES